VDSSSHQSSSKILILSSNHALVVTVEAEAQRARKKTDQELHSQFIFFTINTRNDTITMGDGLVGKTHSSVISIGTVLGVNTLLWPYDTV
jgi:hypothetical protein